MGGVRHVSDILVDDMDAAGKGIVGLQMGTNKLASQKGERQYVYLYQARNRICINIINYHL